ncbi:MAG: hypothetical protein NDI69_10145 [Bacteriovoracaceae bacterium]|nr:hypothetical protein [Bacteriovoracaceae bacterium]
MKLKSFIVALTLTVMSSSAFAWVPFNAPVWVIPGQVKVEVANFNQYPIVCKGRALGTLANGQVLQAEFFEQVIYPGQYRYAFVYSNYVPFVNGWAEILCR